MHAAFEQGAMHHGGRQAGATTARVGVSNVVNTTWMGHLKAQGYSWEVIPGRPEAHHWLLDQGRQTLAAGEVTGA